MMYIATVECPDCGKVWEGEPQAIPSSCECGFRIWKPIGRVSNVHLERLRPDGYGWSSDLGRFTDEHGNVWAAEAAIANGIATPITERCADVP